MGSGGANRTAAEKNSVRFVTFQRDVGVRIEMPSRITRSCVKYGGEKNGEIYGEPRNGVHKKTDKHERLMQRHERLCVLVF